MPGAKDQPHATITGAGHFLQEDAGEEIAKDRGLDDKLIRNRDLGATDRRGVPGPAGHYREKTP